MDKIGVITVVGNLALVNTVTDEDSTLLAFVMFRPCQFVDVFYFLANIHSWHDIINIKGFTLAERSVFYSYINLLDMFTTITTIYSILPHYITSLINNTVWWRSPSPTIYSTLCLRLNKNECESSNLYSDITFPPLIPLILGNKTSIKGEIHCWQPPLGKP